MPRSSGPFQPLSPRASNLYLRVLRCMRLCGVPLTQARWAYVVAVCAYRTLRGNVQRSHVAPIMHVILQDARPEEFPAPEELEGMTVLERATRSAEDDLYGHVLMMIEKRREV